MGKSKKKSSSKKNNTSINSLKIEGIGSHDVTKSPTKKSSKSHSHSTADGEKMLPSTSKINDSSISKNNLLEIKKMIEADLPNYEDLPNYDKRSFRVTMAKLDFTKFEEEIGVPGDLIKKKLEYLFSKVNCVKNMQEMLNACFGDIDKLLKLNNTLKDDAKPKKVTTKSPYDYFAMKNPNLEDVRNEFEVLSDKRKLKFITKSVQEYVAAHENPEATVACKVRKDHFFLYFRSIEMPALEFKSSLHLYLHEHPDEEKEVDGVERSLKMLLLFNSFKKHEKYLYYEEKFKKLRAKYIEDFNKWFPGIAGSLKVHAEAIKMEIVKRMEKEGKDKLVKKKSRSSTMQSALNTMVMNSIKKSSHTSFPEEPKMKASSPKELYKYYLMYNGKDNKDISTSFSSLPAKDRETFNELAKQELDKYKQDIKNFTDCLPDHDKKIYIGQNRIRFLKLFQGIDIYHSDYPSSEFPAFKPITKEERAQIIKNKMMESDTSIMKGLKNIMSHKEDSDGFTTKKLPETSTPMLRNVKEEVDDEEEDDEDKSDDEEEDYGNNTTGNIS